MFKNIIKNITYIFISFIQIYDYTIYDYAYTIQPITKYKLYETNFFSMHIINEPEYKKVMYSR